MWGTCKNFPLYVAGVIANVTAGAAFTWTSPVLPKLHQSGNPLGAPITAGQDSWIMGLLSFGSMFGLVVAGYSANKLGTKTTLLAAACPIFISFLLLAFAGDVALYYLARLLAGVGAGVVFTILPTYLVEIAKDHNRGSLSSLMIVFITSAALFLIGFLVYNSETPVYLASIGQQQKLAASLKKLRKESSKEIQVEATQIMVSLQELNGKKLQLGNILKNKPIRKGLLQATGSGLAPEISSIVIGGMQVGTTTLTSAIVDRLGRRILLIVSSIGSALSLIALGLYFYLSTNNFNVDSLGWLPLTSLVFYILSFNIGLASIPWTLMSEFFSPDVKVVTSSLIGVVAFFCCFITIFFFPALTIAVGRAWSFWIFAIVCVVGTVFVWWMLPETKGKSL